MGRRAVGLGPALLLEGLLVIALLTLGRSDRVHRRMDQASLTSFDVGPPAEPAPQPAPAEPQASSPTRPQPPVATRSPDAATTAPDPSRRWPWLELSSEEMAAADVARIPARPAPAAPAKAGPIGPADPMAAGDSQRVGSAPNGQPLYAAAWYREPEDGELRGYLSTASGPGWGLIACRTVPDYRVEDCVALDEYPAGSRIARAVLAAAWQFRVRPPRIGGRYQVGEWVRIRIDYEQRPG